MTTWFVNRRNQCPSHRSITDQIVITASRVRRSRKQRRRPASRSSTQRASSVLDEPLARDLIRLVPSASVSTSGPGRVADRCPHPRRRSQSHLAVHRRHPRERSRRPATSPVSICSTPTSSRGSRWCAGRNPRSVGIDAIGGVVAVNGVDERQAAIGVARRVARSAFSSRCSARSTPETRKPCRSRRVAAGYRRSTVSTGMATRTAIATSRVVFAGPGSSCLSVELGSAAFAIAGESQFDGFDPVTFLHDRHAGQQPQPHGGGADVGAVWAWTSRWSGRVGASFSSSSNRNYLADEQVNRTSGTRAHLSTRKLEHRLSIGAVAAC